MFKGYLPVTKTEETSNDFKVLERHQKNQITESTEAETNDYIQMVELSRKPFTDKPDTEEIFQFNATPFILQQYSDSFDYHQYVPYQLCFEERGLFPEFYFHFKRAFSSSSTENRAYCSVDLDQFSSFYIGKPQDIKSSIVRVQNDFEKSFRKCLHPELLKDFSTWHLTRSCVETKFQDKLKESTDFVSYAKRIEELTELAREYEVAPLIDFLLAFEHDETSTWHQVLRALTNEYQSKGYTRYLNSRVLAWRKEKLSLPRQVEGLVNQVKELHERHENSFTTGDVAGLCFGLFMISVAGFFIFLVLR